MEPPETIQRRTFLKRAFVLVNGAIAAIVGVPAIRYLLDPLARSRQANGFIRILPVSALVPGKPARAAVIADRKDAYTHYPPGPIGQVFLIREPDGPTGPIVRCLQTICPHLGCAINESSDAESFACPCHTSDFNKDGQRRAGPAPRGMDPLDCHVTTDADGRQWVEVKYQEFVAGIAERIVKT